MDNCPVRIPDMTLYYSRISTYGGGGLEMDPGVDEPGCPDLYHHKYVESDRSSEMDSWMLRYGLVIHEALYLMEEETLDYGEALTRVWDPALSMDRWEEAVTDLRGVVERGGLNLHTVAVEQDLSCHLYTDGEYGDVTYGGRIDWIGVDSNIGDVDVPTIYFADYKTNRGTPSRQDVEEWKQGVGYAMLVAANIERYLPGVESFRIVGIYDAIKRYAIHLEYTPERMEHFRAWASAIARTILRDEDHEPRLNPMCGWCPIRTECELWLGLPGEGAGLLERMSSTPLLERIEQMEEAQKIKGQLDKMIKSTQVAMKERIVVTKKAIPQGDSEWFISQGEKREVDIAVLFRLMGDEFLNVASVTLGKVDVWQEEHLDVDLGPAIRSVPGSPGLKKRKQGE